MAADSSRARIMETRNPFGGLREIATNDHEQSRMHQQGLLTDAPGRAFDRAGPGRHAMDREVTPKKQEAVVFARELARRLAEAESSGRYQRLVIVAAPRFLGHLRACLPDRVKRRVVTELPKDLVKQDVATLRQSLPERL